MTTVGRILPPRPTAGARPRGLTQRHLWLIPGLALGLVANAQAGQAQVGLLPVLVFGIVPHLALLLGIGQPHAQGQLAPRAVALFNAMHHPVPPLAILGLASAGILSPFWFVGALAWLGHIIVDEGFEKGACERPMDGAVRGRGHGDVDERPRCLGGGAAGLSAALVLGRARRGQERP